MSTLDSTVESPPSQRTPPHALPPNLRILVVDDNATIHEDFRKILSPSDFGEAELDRIESAVFGESQTCRLLPEFQLAFAAQGDSAVRLVDTALQQGCPFALALVDVRMPPGMDGIETIKAIWQIQPDLQVALCTAYSDYSWDDIVSQLGLSHRLVILKKPFDPIEVVQIANALTSKWSYEREVALNQLGLQTQLWDSSRRMEDAWARLRQEHEDRLRLEDTLRLMQKVESLGSLATGIAHDFNNVLTVIQGHLTMNLLNEDQPQPVLDSMRQVLTAARRAAELTRQLLLFSNREYQAPRPMQLSALVDSEVSMLRRTLGNHVTISVNHSSIMPDVLADPGSMGQIIVNLAINARDAMPKGGHLILTTRIAKIGSEAEAKDMGPDAMPGEYGVLSVSDNGDGMPLEVLAQVFDPFFTTKEVGKGNGMGLAMVRGLARHQGGWVTVSSVQGVGTDFQVFLPVATAADPARTEARESDFAKTEAPASTIMIVDDDDAVREIMTRALSAQGHTIIGANDAREAWQQWRAHRLSINLVISDINLPGDASGFDLGRALLGDDPNLPLIFTSGYCPDILGQTTSMRLGINYLPKPFDVLDLVNAVNQAVCAAASPHHVSVRQVLSHDGKMADAVPYSVAA